MRRYDDPVEVRRAEDEPDQFLWRGRLWKVRSVVAHWVETGAWWAAGQSELPSQGDLLTERELWRVEAGRGAARLGPDGELDPGGVFDLSFDWADGRWSLVGCAD